MFKILKQSKKSKARLGRLTTSHGVIHTPFFMPDATRGAVKSLSGDDLLRLGLPAMVVNTYHLYLQPGMEVVTKAGGIHKFMNWPGPLLSDSGGYQVFSLIHKNAPARSGSARAGESLGKITDDKVIFRSPLDGSSHELTPEKSIQIQFDLGVDMMVCLDDCPPNDASEPTMLGAIARTIAWAKRCKVEFEKQFDRVCRTKVRHPQNKRPPDFSPADARPLLFGVIQGGTNLELRQQCAEALIAIGFDGYGFGARHVDGEGKFLTKPLQFTADIIPQDKLRFGLGIGSPNDILRAVKMGWDMFDCVIPTREARHGKLYSSRHPERRAPKATGVEGYNDSRKTKLYPSTSLRFAQDDGFKSINITNAKFKKDFTPINAKSKLPELRHYSKSYLHHLFKTQEPLALRLATLNNVEFYLDLMKRIREAVKNNQL